MGTFVRGLGLNMDRLLIKIIGIHFIKLKNDFVGGLYANTNFSNGYIWMMYEPLQLMEQIEKRLEESDCTDADKKVLKELYDSLDEDDNNIMFIGKLKK